MNPSFKKGDKVKTKHDGDGVIVGIYVHKDSHREYAYKVKLEQPDKYGNIEIDAFSCDLDYEK